MTTTMIADFTLPQRSVLHSTMAYREMGRPGAPVALFLHGNPTSSYIWRNVIPFVAPVARCIAPDLIGYGQSGKPDIDYRFEDQVRYLDAFITAAGIGSAYLVAQDWGTALAFHLAARRPDFVRGLAFMEFIRPMPTWDDFHQVPAARETFRKFRTPGEGEQMILNGNAFVERILPGSILRKLSEEEMAVYRAPFPSPESRRPTWRLRTNCLSRASPRTSMPSWSGRIRRWQLRIIRSCFSPGSRRPRLAALCRAVCFRLADCVVHLGAGAHYLQEDHPETIGKATAAWITRIEAAQREGNAA